ncbi:MAG: hypothetical protein KDK05_05830 [Candidatus Competibacteraceae bacterium]|nr:hypothetical protein [Candidatus Competibacteraceae bacterium]MCB1805214.1 hypothetical protein [Candidatus Competibacteraceae bacterium]
MNGFYICRGPWTFQGLRVGREGAVWVLDDRFNTEAFGGDIDGVFTSIGGRKVFPQPPTDEAAVLLPPQWSQ